MALRIIWKDFDPRIQRIHFVYGTIGPRLDRYERWDELPHYYVLFPYTVWTVIKEDFEIFHSITEKIAKGEEHELTEKEKRILDELEVIHIPEDVYETMDAVAKIGRQKWAKVEPTFNEVIHKVLGHEPFGEVFVYPAFTFKHWDGTVYRSNVLVLATEPSKIDVDPRILVRELIHIVVEADKGFEHVFKALMKKYEIPTEEAFVETLTNLVLWKAGITETMFARYYDESLKELCELEDKIREIVREWWINGGNLVKMLEGRLGQ